VKLNSPGADTVDKAFKLSTESKAILFEAGFPLHKFVTNLAELQKLLPRNSFSPKIQIDVDQATKVFGLVWNQVGDCFTKPPQSFVKTKKRKPPLRCDSSSQLSLYFSTH